MIFCRERTGSPRCGRRASARLLLFVLGVTIVSSLQFRAPTRVRAQHASSSAVAIVPAPCGQSSGAGCLPTAGYSAGYAPSFANRSVASLPSTIAGYDTVVLNQVGDIGDQLNNTA